MKGVKSGFTLIELLIVVAIIAILAAIAVPNFLEAQTRAKVSRVRTDLRTMATAMESYKIDTNRYTSYGHLAGGFNELKMDGSDRTQGTPLSYPWQLAGERGGTDAEWFYFWFRTFLVAPPVGLNYVFPNLTTPVAYLTSFPGDPFGFTPGGPYGYQHTHKHSAWMIYSAGPSFWYGLNSSLDSDWNNDRYISFNYQPGFRARPWVLSPVGGNPTDHLLTGDASNHPGAPPDGLGANTYDSTNGTKSTGCIWRIGP